MGCIQSTSKVQAPIDIKKSPSNMIIPKKAKQLIGVQKQGEKLKKDDKNIHESNEDESESENESVCSRNNAKRNKGKLGDSFIQKEREQEEEKQRKQGEENKQAQVIQEYHLIDDSDENDLKMKIQNGEQKQAHSLISEDKIKDSIQTRECEQQLQLDLEYSRNDLQGEQERVTINEHNDDGYCNVLRKQANISQTKSISMQTQGQRLYNSNIVTTGLDYEQKRRELIRKISDNIDELDELDENNYQIGVHNQSNVQSKKHSLVEINQSTLLNGNRKDPLIVQSQNKLIKIEKYNDDDDFF